MSKMFCWLFNHFFVSLPKQLNLVPRFSRLTVQKPATRLHFWHDFDIIGSIWQNSCQIWSTVANYGELQPIRNGEIFWMNSNNKFIHSTEQLLSKTCWLFYLISWKTYLISYRHFKFWRTILQCWPYYVRINFARHQHDTKRTQNRAVL